MMDTDQFYITLPSNTYDFDSIFPNNTLASYKTVLDAPIHLEKHEKYEVALAEVTLNAHIYNLFDEKPAFTVLRLKDALVKSGKLPLKRKMETILNNGKRYYAESIYFKRGYYEHFSEFIRMLNKQLSESAMCYDLTFELLNQHEGSAKFILKSSVGDDGAWFNFVFLSGKKWQSAISQIKGDFYFLCDIRKLFTYPGTGYLMCNLIHYQRIGNTQAKVLRILNFDPEKSNSTISFNPRQYLPISEDKISLIEIDIKDVLGISYPFDAGQLNVVLHIQRIKEI
jgi:hypothetical protein